MAIACPNVINLNCASNKTINIYPYNDVPLLPNFSPSSFPDNPVNINVRELAIGTASDKSGHEMRKIKCLSAKLIWHKPN